VDKHLGPVAQQYEQRTALLSVSQIGDEIYLRERARTGAIPFISAGTVFA
jgi:hypothetical protein